MFISPPIPYGHITYCIFDGQFSSAINHSRIPLESPFSDASWSFMAFDNCLITRSRPGSQTGLIIIVPRRNSRTIICGNKSLMDIAEISILRRLSCDPSSFVAINNWPHVSCIPRVHTSHIVMGVRFISTPISWGHMLPIAYVTGRSLRLCITYGYRWKAHFKTTRLWPLIFRGN